MVGTSRRNARRIEQVAASFTRTATAVRVPWRYRAMYWSYYVALARRGVPVFSDLRDAQYENGFYKRGYDRWCEKINRHLSRAPVAVETVPVPSFAHGELDVADVQQLMRHAIPFVIRDGARALPVRNWSLDYIDEVAGDCTVPINGAADRPAADTSRPTKQHHYYDFHTGPLSEVVQSIRDGGNLRVSTAEDVMHHDGGRLRADLDLPWFEQLSGWSKNQHHWFRSRSFAGKVVGAQLLLQPQNAFTLWHAEPGDNFFVLAKGDKTWTLAHPYYTAAMRPRVKSTTNYHGSNIDIREPHDVLRQRGYDGYLRVPKVAVTLQPGDVLRVPNHWWHTVVTHPGQYTLAATIRANSSPNMTGIGYTLLRLFDAQYHALAKSFLTKGRIDDSLIGFPRKSRSVTDGTR